MSRPRPMPDATIPLQRSISRVVSVPPLAPGFIGPGHVAAQVLGPEDFALNDPFILLMDDHLDIGERPLGEPHPHAGFETVTLLLEGSIYDRDEGGTIGAGEVQWMTAGRGIIHGEHMAARGRVRLLQLWLTLPKSRRRTIPSFQTIHADAVPIRREPGVEMRIYSGFSGELSSLTRNHVPVTMVEITLAPHASVEQEIPATYNGFVLPIRGSARVGGDVLFLETGEVGWLDRPEADGGTVVHLQAGHGGARLVLYAGEPQGDSIVSQGPFVGDSREDIVRFHSEYRAGRFPRMSTLARQLRSA